MSCWPVREPVLVVPDQARFPAGHRVGRSPPRLRALQQAEHAQEFDSRMHFFEANQAGRRVVLAGPPLLDLDGTHRSFLIPPTGACLGRLPNSSRCGVKAPILNFGLRVTVPGSSTAHGC